MDPKLIKQQSEAAYKQWSRRWKKHSKIHSSLDTKNSIQDFENVGIGKAIVCVANGYSFEENLETLKKYQDKVDIMCCDKTLGHLIDNGIFPTYALVCDAKVNYRKYMKKWEDKLDKTTLFINVNANPQWSHAGNWREKYFFVNKDIIGSEKEFSELSGCPNVIPAGTNVSNAMLILLTLCDNNLKRNFFGYDKILLIGFDYSWKYGGKYYAFDEAGGGKVKYMRHAYITTPSGECAYTSGNLAFSMNWIHEYIKVFQLPVVQCGKDSILFFGKTHDLEEQIQYKYKTEDRYEVKRRVDELRKLIARQEQLKGEVNKIAKDHFWSFARSV